MTAKELLHIINNGDELGETEFQSLVQLYREFPYFVLPTILAAKYQQNHTPQTGQEFLPIAATQSPDRRRLKFLIENPIPLLPSLSDQLLLENKIDNLSNEPAPNEDMTCSQPAEIIQSEQENNNDSTIISGEKAEHGGKNEIELPKKSSNKKPRKDVLKELEENLTRLKSPGQENSATPAEFLTHEIQELHSKAESPFPELSPDALLAVINKRKEKNVLDKKKQIQDEMIDEFNKKTIKFNVTPTSQDLDEAADLSIESTRLKENLISESFAKILVRQKKITEAKEIYQKLQLKFPDKKAYFADCLKQLDNN